MPQVGLNCASRPGTQRREEPRGFNVGKKPDQHQFPGKISTLDTSIDPSSNLQLLTVADDWRVIVVTTDYALSNKCVGRMYYVRALSGVARQKEMLIANRRRLIRCSATKPRGKSVRESLEGIRCSDSSYRLKRDLARKILAGNI